MMHFEDETLYLAIHLLNRTLSLLKVPTADQQLLGIVCLYIAAKRVEWRESVPRVCHVTSHIHQSLFFFTPCS